MKTFKLYLAALLLMICSAVNAQKAEPYLNVHLVGGSVKSFPVSTVERISWGEKEEYDGTGSTEREDGVKVNWVQLWEDGPKFAEYNIGAQKATDYGDYYTWGARTSLDNDTEDPKYYNTGNANLSGWDDTATFLWGPNWRMPNQEELSSLFNSTLCTANWTTIDGVYGYKFTGKGDYAENFIFIPASGCWYIEWDTYNKTGEGEWSYCWSSSKVGWNNENAYYFIGNTYGPQIQYGMQRRCALPIRAVMDPQDIKDPKPGSEGGEITPTPTTYTITVYTDPEMCVVEGSGTYTEGETVTLTAYCPEYYRFIRWSDGETANPYVFTASKDMTLTAYFAPNEDPGTGGGSAGGDGEDNPGPNPGGGDEGPGGGAGEGESPGSEPDQVYEEEELQWIQLWEGGPEFASYNLGAVGPTDPGKYYTWGAKTSIDEDQSYLKYYNQGYDKLTGEDDIVTQTYNNDNYRMPTYDDFEKLIENCEFQWIWQYKNSYTRGYLVTSKYYPYNSIFLPVAGKFDVNYNTSYGKGEFGTYWTSEKGSNGLSATFYFDEWYKYLSSDEPSMGFSIRPVREAQQTPEEEPTVTLLEGTTDDVEWVQLWEDGPKFAKWNLGTNSSYESGNYYTWGGKMPYSEDTEEPKYYRKVNSSYQLLGKEDTATRLLGNNWRTPTNSEMYNLFYDNSKCTQEWTTDYNGMAGYIIRSKADKSKFIFLPAAGKESTDGVTEKNTKGYYWSSDHGYWNGTDAADFYTLWDDGYSDNNRGYSGIGYSIRPVINENPVEETTGTAKRNGGEDVTWVQLWENGPKFAEYNVGANNETEVGGYFKWSTTTSYSYGNVYPNEDYSAPESNLDGETDIATYHWGNDWRMPTRDEFANLSDHYKCKIEVEERSGVIGYKISGYDHYSENNIFIPFGGCIELHDVWDDDYSSWSYKNTGHYRNEQLYLWSSTGSWSYDGHFQGQCLFTESGNIYILGVDPAKMMNVRPILKESSND